ncbi:MAG: DNA-3-methyladenine glycosylase I [Pseudomonadales bacterium]|nr:DNA-3-methyladenine glycosylase I [Pseudomonadales bacterium]
MKTRCSWCGSDPLYVAYHDEEWGVPVHDERMLFEFLTLECQQAGLSWITVLRKRENYRKQFFNFDPKKVAKMTDEDIEARMQDAGLIRNRAKLNSIRSNALAFLAIQKEFGSFDRYIWSFVDGTVIDGRRGSLSELPATSQLSDTISKDLKKRGFKFVGSTIVYAHMQATGMINDHVQDCFRYQEVKTLARD